MRKYLSAVLIILTLGFMSALVYAIYAYQEFVATPIIPLTVSFDYLLKPGNSVTNFADELQKQGYLKNRWYFIALAYQKGIIKNLKAGEYIFPAGSSPSQLLDQLAAGKIIYRRFALIEGWTFAHALAALERNPYVTHNLANLDTIAVVTKLGLPLGDPEGLFLPATYRFTRGTSDISLLQDAHRFMTTELQKEWQKRATGLPYKNPYQALIVASLVEKETGQTNERPLVAGVILKRLQINMPLQIDAAVIYGLRNSCGGRLTRADLHCETPYNTYKHKGLPPTPISMPGRASIHAALNPIISNNLYYVSKNNGTHEFSATLEKQTAAVKKFQLAMVFPVVGKRSNFKSCLYIWYVSPQILNLFSNHC